LHPFCIRFVLGKRREIVQQTDNNIEQKTSKVNYMYLMAETSRHKMTTAETLKNELPKLKVAGSNPVSRSIKQLTTSGSYQHKALGFDQNFD